MCCIPPEKFDCIISVRFIKEGIQSTIDIENCITVQGANYGGNKNNYLSLPLGGIVGIQFLNITIQILWISFASITLPAAQFYHVGDLQIGMLAMVFMIVFIPLSLPVSWMIDTLGFRKSVNIGALIMAVFGILRGVFGGNFTLVMIFTIGLPSRSRSF